MAAAHVALNIDANSAPKRLAGGHTTAAEACFRCSKPLIFFLLFIVLFAALAFAIFLYITYPAIVDFHVTHASVTQFNFTAVPNPDATTLHYNLAFDITLQNPNKAYGVYYDNIEAVASYKNQRFGMLNLNSFYQPQSNTTILKASFQGQKLLLLGAEELSAGANNVGGGVYDIVLKFSLENKYSTSAKITRWHIKPVIRCGLKLNINYASSSSGAFVRSKCIVDKGLRYLTFSSH